MPVHPAGILHTWHSRDLHPYAMFHLRPFARARETGILYPHDSKFKVK